MNDLANFFAGKRVLITGHTGFKGSWLSQILLGWGAKVSGVALEPNTNPSLFQLLGSQDKISNHFADIRDFAKVREIIGQEQPEIVFHLAAQPLVRDSYDDPRYTFDANVLGTVNILQAIKEAGTVRSAVIITTDKVYENSESGRPFKETDPLGGRDPYSASKAAAELVTNSYLQSFFDPANYQIKHSTLIASARPGNVIGGGDWQKDRLVPDVVRSIFDSQTPVIIRNPGAIRPWQYVLEPLYGYLLLAQGLYAGKTELSRAWNFGPREENYLTVGEVVDRTLQLLRRGTYAVRPDNQKHEAGCLRLDSSDARQLLLWQPRLGPDEVLGLTMDWYQRFYNGEDMTQVSRQQIESFFNKNVWTAVFAGHQ